LGFNLRNIFLNGQPQKFFSRKIFENRSSTKVFSREMRKFCGLIDPRNFLPAKVSDIK